MLKKGQFVKKKNSNFLPFLQTLTDFKNQEKLATLLDSIPQIQDSITKVSYIFKISVWYVKITDLHFLALID